MAIRLIAAAIGLAGVFELAFGPPSAWPLAWRLALLVATALAAVSIRTIETARTYRGNPRRYRRLEMPYSVALLIIGGYVGSRETGLVSMIGWFFSQAGAELIMYLLLVEPALQRRRRQAEEGRNA